MALVHNTNIVRSGLVLHLDAANRKSYPGTGTTWTDLSSAPSPQLLGTMPTYSTDGIGCFDFSANLGLNSTTAVSGFFWSPQPIPNTGSFTFDCWVKNVPATVGQQVLFSNSADANGFRFGIGANAVYYLIGPTYTEGGLTFSSFINTQWNNVCVVFDRLGTHNSGAAQLRGYLNGVLYNSVTLPASQTAWPSSGYGTAYMAKWNGNTFSSFSGKIGKFGIYSRSLSAAEVRQNFEATRDRYGI